MIHESRRRLARLRKIQLAVAEVDRLVFDASFDHRADHAVSGKRRLLPVGGGRVLDPFRAIRCRKRGRTKNKDNLFHVGILP